MRKLSYLFLVMGALAPLVTWFFIARERRIYAARFGEAPEGTGLFGIVVLGAFAALMFFAVSAIFGINSYRVLNPPRALLRKIEVALLLLPSLVVIWFICVGLLGLPFDVPLIIETK